MSRSHRDRFVVVTIMLSRATRRIESRVDLVPEKGHENSRLTSLKGNRYRMVGHVDGMETMEVARVALWLWAARI